MNPILFEIPLMIETGKRQSWHDEVWPEIGDSSEEGPAEADSYAPSVICIYDWRENDQSPKI